jgi:hypothetical protein
MRVDPLHAAAPQGPNPFSKRVHLGPGHSGHHDDAYPTGSDRQARDASHAACNVGGDFERKNDPRTDHGEVVARFPQRPRRGFETVTVVRRGIHRSRGLAGRAAASSGKPTAAWRTRPAYPPLPDARVAIDPPTS